MFENIKTYFKGLFKEKKDLLNYEQVYALLKFHYDYQNKYNGHLKKFDASHFHSSDIIVLNQMIDKIIEIENLTEELSFKEETNYAK